MRALMGGEVDLTSVEGFLSLEAFSFFYPILLLAFAVSYGAGIIGSEEENGTLDLLLATPVPRWRVILEKFGALVVFTVIVLLTIYLGFLAGALAVDIEGMDNVFILQGVLNMLPITLFFAALALFLTALRSGGRGLALGVTLGLAAISYLIFSMAEISNIPLWLRRLSPWYYYNGANLAREGINAGHTALLLGLTVLLVGGSLWAFQRRDVGV
jgi:ABC-2 type transport system permease protein